MLFHKSYSVVSLTLIALHENRIHSMLYIAVSRSWKNREIATRNPSAGHLFHHYIIYQVKITFTATSVAILK